MIYKKVVVFTIIIILVLTIGGYFVFQPSPVQDANIIDIKLIVDAPFSTETVLIGNSGKTGSKKISQENINSLVKVIEDNNFYSLDDVYPFRETGDPPSPSDGSSYSIEIIMNGTSKNVSCYSSECPDEFRNVMNKIKELWGKKISEVGV